MGPIRATLLVTLLIALGVWSCYFLPGWVGLLAGAVLLLCALIATLAVLFGRGERGRATRLWKEFCDFLYGL
ncbi:hypothetical protein [Stenotrophomonas sp.]|uniref:hypothetical protein n=1 Tax=Stenotrophomonas sp. TaxID=69392 RepID=UPI0028A9647A|nr:hypothetical protein [Stenotrophomonas sp.]